MLISFGVFLNYHYEYVYAHFIVIQKYPTPTHEKYTHMNVESIVFLCLIYFDFQY